MRKTLSAAAAGVPVSTLILAACASAPQSYIEGVPLTRTDPTLYPVRVVSIDEQIQFARPGTPVQLAPGLRWVVLEAEGGKSARQVVQKSFALKIAPCSRYFFAARRDSPMDADWTLVEDRREPVAPCNVEEELRKAGPAAAAAAASGPR
ncbi:hypothetical protein [Roseateles violae]|nr:hypothetical protein [Pelomonas sp. PFR6]